MVKIKKYAASMLIGAVLVGCSAEETSEPKKTVEKAATVEEEFQSIEDKAHNEMKENFMDNKEEAVNVVESLKRILEEPMDDSLVEAGFDKEYDWYLKSQKVSNEVDEFLRFQDKPKSSDLLNVRLLAATIGHLQYVRTAHIDDTGGETEAQTAVDDWKPASLDLNYSYEENCPRFRYCFKS
ncbi:hypothetical protein FGG79_03005 [Bacillus sp. BHET2]|uniref:hypothetical protein n=1 Tax=Bacillus sp. BHET2 TaxID=2583818 RepID=UPI00110EABA2|nr:hypothetical protein [Bacillus sp. BHET2]TMU87123.1 hypothetical protein FGG79_03005 [Bacillus sp. BHET2]